MRRKMEKKMRETDRMSLSDFLAAKGHTELEGNCANLPGQMEHLRGIVRNPNIRFMLEIGFNAGHSADVFLSENPNLKLVSYDIGEHLYTLAGKQYIDEKYPGRHTLVLGDSKETLPRNRGKFDCFFIDGGHDYLSASSDMRECARLANPYALVIMDDVVESTSADYTIEPTRVWAQSLESGLVSQIFKAEYGNARGMAVGFYSGTGAVMDRDGKTADFYHKQKKHDKEVLYNLVESSIKELERSGKLPEYPMTTTEDTLYTRLYMKLTSVLALMMISNPS